ncbi:TonB-dependent receptor [soil metagenome]
MSVTPRAFTRALMLGAAVAALSHSAYAADIDMPEASSEAAADQDSTTVTEIEVNRARSAAARAQAPNSVESVDAATIGDTVNAMNVEDQLKYLPNVFVRKRHIGDTQAPMTTRTSGVGSSARSVIYVDGVLISSLVANSNGIGSPRWGMAPADAIDRIEVLYGPFSAAYPGNSIGAAVEITTRDPQAFEGQVRIAGQVQDFQLFAIDDRYRSGEIGAVFGDRRGPFTWRLSGQHVVSNSQPLSIVTATRPASPSAAGTLVTGAVADLNRTGAPIIDIGAGGFEHQVQDNDTLKLTYDVTPALKLAYTLGRFGNDTDASAQTFLRDAAGSPFYSGTVNVGGYAYAVAASAFSNSVYSLDETHWMNSLAARWHGGERFDGRLVLSAYDFSRDIQRTPSTALPAAAIGGAGSIIKLDGTGWRTADLSGAYRPMGFDGAHAFSFGLHADRFELQNQRFATTDWISGSAGSLTAASRGKTQTTGVYGQDVWRPSGTVTVTVGARLEHWRAFDGVNFSAIPALSVSQPRLNADKVSPKAAVAWRPADGWRLSASYGEAYRFPTVSELYQAITTGATLSVPNPNLKPEHARSFELAAERKSEAGRIRLSYFEEHLEDALISQSAPLVTGSATLFNYVQNLDRVRTRGVELVAERMDVVIKGLDLSGSVTLTDPVITRDPVFPAAVGKQTPGVPKTRVTAVATYRTPEYWTLTLAARYSDKVYSNIDNTDVIGHTWQGFEDYFIIDARAAYKLDDHWTAAIGVDNANDKSFFLFHPFPQRAVTAELNYRF